MQFYVIMPVGSDPRFADKKAVLEKLAEREGLEAHFPFDRTSGKDFDIDKTLSALRKSDFVLADLSRERPSCYFELGLAQAIGKNVYLTAEEGTDIHQAHGRSLASFYHDLPSYERVISSVLKEAKLVRPFLRLRA